MHTTASSLVAIAQYFWRPQSNKTTSSQQKFNIEAVNDYPPIWFEIRFEWKFLIRMLELWLGSFVGTPVTQSPVAVLAKTLWGAGPPSGERWVGGGQ